MSKIMLINAVRQEEVRAAILQDKILENLDIEVQESSLRKGNIYKGVVTGVEPSLEACFVNYGVGRDGFLSMDEITSEVYLEPYSGRGRPPIRQVIKKGQELLVQVLSDGLGTKGASLSTYPSLAGRFLVLLPYSDSRGVSRKLDGNKREDLKAIVEKLDLPQGVGAIVRTSGIDQTKRELNRDLGHLLRLWMSIQRLSRTIRAPALIYHDRDLVVRSLRDYFTTDMDEVWIDDPGAYDRAKKYFEMVMPRQRRCLQLYRDRAPIFSRFEVEEQIERIYERKVELAGGGSIVIDPTEALIAIDVNSGKNKREGDVEATALRTNTEAAAEIARQLRLRDLGGIIVIDFIDMYNSKNERAVEKAFRDAVKIDKARIDMARISNNGLLELTRQRLKQPVRLQKQRACPTCQGNGVIPSVESVWLSLLRRVELQATTKKLSGVRAGFHFEIANYILNSKRADLLQLEREFGIEIKVSAQPGLHRSDSDVQFVDAPAAKRTGRGRPPDRRSQPSEQRKTETAEPDRKRPRRRRRRKKSTEVSANAKRDSYPRAATMATHVTARPTESAAEVEPGKPSKPRTRRRIWRRSTSDG